MHSKIIVSIPQNLNNDFKFLKEVFKYIWSLFLMAVCILDEKLKRNKQGKKYNNADTI